jgi:hypothetical protein
MRGVRNTGFVVSLALLASLVGHFAIQKHFERRTRGMIARLSSESASPSDTSLFHSSRPPALFDRSTAPHLLDDTPSPGQVISALGVHERFTGGRAQVVQAQQTENPPTTVPAPTDAAPVDASLSDSSHEAEIHPGDANAVRNVIEHELSHATREEREIWYDELKSLPAGVVRDLLQVRKQIRALPRLLGGIPEKLASTDSSISNRTHEIAAEPASQKIRFSVPDQLFATTAMEAAISQLRHNLANAATPGYKRLRVMLVDSYVQSSLDTNGLHDPQTEPSPGANFQGEGCRLAPLLLDLKQGLLKKTGRQLDLAITGEGFFVVRRGEREFLTRCGAFTLDRNRFLCLANSNDNSVLQPPICVPDDAHEIQVSADGIVPVPRVCVPRETRCSSPMKNRAALCSASHCSMAMGKFIRVFSNSPTSTSRMNAKKLKSS